MGTIPVLLSYAQAAVWGANPITLVSGGVVASILLVVSSYIVARRAFGPEVAAWGPRALDVRLDGSNLALGSNYGRTPPRRGLARRRVRGLSLPAGRGVEAIILPGPLVRSGCRLDSMFLVSLAGLVPAAIGGWWVLGRTRSGAICAGVFLAGLLVGATPRDIGARLDPHDAYQEQFSHDLRTEVFKEHARSWDSTVYPV